MISMLLASVLAVTQVYRLERDTETERLWLVGADNVKRECCILDPDEYAVLTGRVDQVWQSLNRTHEGRRTLHGNLVSQEIADGQKTDVYADGYRFSVPLEAKRPARPTATVTTNVVKGVTITSRLDMSERQRKMRERLREAKSAKVREVTVEHDAATGKDMVK